MPVQGCVAARCVEQHTPVAGGCSTGNLSANLRSPRHALGTDMSSRCAVHASSCWCGVVGVLVRQLNGR